MTQLPAGGAGPDRDEARRWLQEELATGDYQLRDSVVERFLRWLEDLLPSPGLTGALPAWTTWLVLAAVVVAVLAVLTHAARDRWRGTALEQRPAASVLPDRPLGATAYRDRAERALAGGDAGTALVEAYRAVAAEADERGWLSERPGRTAHELATELGARVPELAGDLATAADRFDAVRYGDGRATTDEALAVLGVGSRLEHVRVRRTPARPPASGVPG